MDGSEDRRISGDEEPPWLRRLRWWRYGFDLAFPPVVLMVALVVVPIALWRFPELRDPTAAGTLGGLLLSAAGVVWRMGKR
jgi:hypothetical protein